VIWEHLQERGWVDFGDAPSTITRFFDQVGSFAEPGGETDLVATDLIHLTAAELSLPQGLGAGRGDAPFFLEVQDRASRQAAFRSDCGPFKSHNPAAQPRLWDVPVYASDASKLAWVAETESVEVLAERFVPAVQRLASLYEDLGRRGDAPWRRDVFAAGATLWRAKVAVLLREADVDEMLRTVHSSLSG
jgi:hypothetical protein